MRHLASKLNTARCLRPGKALARNATTGLPTASETPRASSFPKASSACSHRPTSCHAKRRLAFFLFDVNGCRWLTHRGSDLDQQGNRPGCRARRYHCIDLK